jgi:orotidine-5'-phosphate decarboxylase
MTTSVYERIIWSADVGDEAAVMERVNLLPDLRIVKIDRLFVDRNGFGVMDHLRGHGLKVFDDAKIVEIPSKLEAIAKVHLRHRPWMLNCMAGCLSSGEMSRQAERDEQDGLKRFADACHEAGTKPCIVTVLTSKRDNIVDDEFNGRTAIDQVFYYVDAALTATGSDAPGGDLKRRRSRRHWPPIDQW